MAGTRQVTCFDEDPTSPNAPPISPATASSLFVVGVGGSVAEPAASRILANALQGRDDIAFIYVDKSSRALSDHTTLSSYIEPSFPFQPIAADTQLRAGRVYIAPPDAYVSVENGVVKLLPPPIGQDEILPFDFLLLSIARAYKNRSIAIILSGPGGDGSIGAPAIKEKGGVVIAQDPDEALQRDMPCSAIAAGVVDLVLPLHKIPAVIGDIASNTQHLDPSHVHEQRKSTDYLLEIADLMHTRIAEGFIRLQPSLLHRNIERRMADFRPQMKDPREYLRVLRNDGHELGMLVADITGMQRESSHSQDAHGRDADPTADTLAMSGNSHAAPTEMRHIGTGEMVDILASVDAAGFLIDRQLRLRFFTPRAAEILGFESGHLGMKLAEVSSSAMAAAFIAEARSVMETGKATESEIVVAGGMGYMRHAVPHRDSNGGMAGVAFGLKHVFAAEREDELTALRRQAEIAAVARQHLLSTSHSLRQPLQTLALLHGLLAKTADTPGAQELLALADNTVTAMTGMLTTLMNINYTEGSPAEVDIVSFPINSLLDHMRNEFSYHARKPQHDLKIVPCGLIVASNRPFLELIIRNFLLNAVKFTPKGKLLLGCRRRGEFLRIEVWDTGMGISLSNPEEIFDEQRKDQRYHGFGLNSARRLGALLGHRVGVRSWQGKGSVFFVDVPIAKLDIPPLSPSQSDNDLLAAKAERLGSDTNHEATTVYTVDDDIHFRAALRRTLEGEGLRVEDFGNAEAFLSANRPNSASCLLIDAYLPGMSGLDLLKRLRDGGDCPPAIMITGNSDVRMAVEAMKTGAVDFIEKPVNSLELLTSIERVLERLKDTNGLQAWRSAAAKQIATLSPRQLEIMRMVLAGDSSKVIAARLGISQRTVESHRATIMKKTGCKSLPELARLSLAAISNETGVAETQHGFPKELLERLLQ